MATVDYAVEAKKARELRRRTLLGQMDYRRELSRLAGLGGTQRQLAQALGISQPSLSSALKAAQKVPAAREGFAGADPYEICLRYSVGELSCDEVIDQLTRWKYVARKPQEHDYFDDLRFEVPGSIDDVVRAADDGLIDGEVYDRVISASAVDRE